jgi:hypothetical protein
MFYARSQNEEGRNCGAGLVGHAAGHGVNRTRLAGVLLPVTCQPRAVNAVASGMPNQPSPTIATFFILLQSGGKLR